MPRPALLLLSLLALLPACTEARHDLDFTNGLGMEMVRIRPTPFAPQGVGLALIRPRIEYWIARHETRQREFQEVMGSNPSAFPDPENPVERVTYAQATEFCQRLTAREHAAGRLPAGFVYALPSEFQWKECLAGAPWETSVTRWRSAERGGPSTAPAHVGSGDVNALGLSDMRGNVREISSTCLADLPSLHGVRKPYVFGDDWWTPFHSAYHWDGRYTISLLDGPYAANDYTGFRCVLTPEGYAPSATQPHSRPPQ